MKTQSDNIFNGYQHQIATAQEILQVLVQGVGRMENMWLEQTGKVFEEQLKFFQASATKDPQELTTLPFALFSDTPNDLINTQQQILEVVTETQAKISSILKKHVTTVLKAEEKPFLATHITNSAIGLTGACFSTWQQALQDAMKLAAMGIKAFPVLPLEPSSSQIDDKEEVSPSQSQLIRKP